MQHRDDEHGRLQLAKAATFRRKSSCPLSKACWVPAWIAEKHRTRCQRFRVLLTTLEIRVEKVAGKKDGNTFPGAGAAGRGSRPPWRAGGRPPQGGRPGPHRGAAPAPHPPRTAPPIAPSAPPTHRAARRCRTGRAQGGAAGPASRPVGRPRPQAGRGGPAAMCTALLLTCGGRVTGFNACMYERDDSQRASE